jgi:hypothetical protein
MYENLVAMSPRRCLAALATAGLIAGGAGVAQAQVPGLPEADQACLACHAEAIGAKAFAATAHAGNGCASCHTDVDVAQHPGNVGALKAVERPGALASRACATCHAEAVPQHQKWLPNAGHHLEIIECAACHSPGAKRRVELRLHDAKAKGELTTRDAPEAAAGTKPLDAEALRAVVARARMGAEGAVMVFGRVDVPDAADAHRLGRKDTAVKECATCHRKGSDTFTKVGLSVIGPDGQRTRYEVDPAVLHGPTSIDDVRGFYALGGTRIGALDILLGLAVLGGITAPLGHAVVRRILARKEGHK